MASPKQEMRMTGRRPKRSDHAPSMGEKMNCMLAQARPNQPIMEDARAKSPPSKLRMRSGKMGAMMPKERKSNATITRIKANTARPGDFSVTGDDGDDTEAPKPVIVAGKERGRK